MRDHTLKRFGIEEFARDFEKNRSTYTTKEKEIFNVLIRMIKNISSQLKNKNVSS